MSKDPPEAAPIINPTKATGMEDLPEDVVALLVWRNFTGNQPMTIVVTKESWMRNHKIAQSSRLFHPDRIYIFDSPVNEAGRQTVFQLQGIVGWAANVYVGDQNGPE